MSHLLVTNDFLPKVGGIQSYLWELWRRLPPERVHVLTTPQAGAAEFDTAQPYAIDRVRAPVLLPFDPAIARTIRRLDPDLVVLDPALPLGLAGHALRRPYAIVVHGAEVTVPGRIPGARAALAGVLQGAAHVIAAGRYPQAEVLRVAHRRPPPTTNIPPGVDTQRFHPLDASERRKARASFGLPEDGHVVLGLSRLVPRKGMDVLIEAFAKLRPSFPDATLAIAGTGRDRTRLESIAARAGVAVRFLGFVGDDAVAALYACADVFAMLCRNRWAGLEQEGFGIVFMEAAACGVPSIAGASGGAAEAVVDGETGHVAADPRDARAVSHALGALLDDDDRRLAMGAAARARAEADFSYDVLAGHLDAVLRDLER